MTPEQAAKKAQKIMEPPWDDLRERRVLNEILAKGQAAQPTRRTAWVLVPAAGLALATSLVVLFLVFWHPGEPSQSVAEGPQPTTITFPDGSLALLSQGATVNVVRQEQGHIELTQHDGQVRYEVSRRPSRPFVVHVRHLSIHVVGTVFIVGIEGQTATVTVEQGRVQVDDGLRPVEMTASGRSQITLGLVQPEPHGPEPDASTPVADSGDSGAGREASPARGAADIETLLREADEARARGRFGKAASILRRVIRNQSGDRRMTTTLFSLGRVESARGRHGAAARAYRQCRTRSPRGPLAEDALAGEARAWAAAGRRESARQAAQLYVSRHPNGPHKRRMEALLE